MLIYVPSVLSPEEPVKMLKMKKILYSQTPKEKETTNNGRVIFNIYIIYFVTHASV